MEAKRAALEGLSNRTPEGYGTKHGTSGERVPVYADLNSIRGIDMQAKNKERGDARCSAETTHSSLESSASSNLKHDCRFDSQERLADEGVYTTAYGMSDGNSIIRTARSTAKAPRFPLNVIM